jgi:serine protease Do
MMTVALGELPTDALARGGMPQPEQPAESGDLLDGVVVRDLDNRARREFSIPNSIRGALVVSVEEGSPSAEAGLRAGDVVVEINRQTVKTADDAVKLSDGIKTGRVLLRVWSNGAGAGGPGGTRYVVVEKAK